GALFFALLAVSEDLGGLLARVEPVGLDAGERRLVAQVLGGLPQLRTNLLRRTGVRGGAIPGGLDAARGRRGVDRRGRRRGQRRIDEGRAGGPRGGRGPAALPRA